ncbi:MAG TPA: cytochrome c oxidase subunit II [Stenomitos sp.]
MPRNLFAAALALAGALTATPAFAVAGMPNATPIADRVDGLYNLIFWITFVIFVGVWAAMAYVLIRYRYRPGREAKQFHGHTGLEIIWTVLPTLALIAISIPTYKTIRYVDNAPKPDLTVQVVGHQWFWEFKYPDNHVDVSNADLVLPANRVVKLLVSSADVVHNFGVTDFGFSMDAIPGHINEGWVYLKAPGEHQLFCRQLCGTLHAKMMAKVKVVPDAEFASWVQSKGGTYTPGEKSAQAAPQANAAEQAAPKQVAAAPKKADGAALYSANCASCHQATGEGMAGTFPPLAGSEIPNGPAAEHIKIVLHGKSGPLTVKGQQYNGAMPPFPQLSDEEIAAILTYERTSWGNKGGAVTPEQVKALR